MSKMLASDAPGGTAGDWGAGWAAALASATCWRNARLLVDMTNSLVQYFPVEAY
jgi:hypothetical protein